MELVSPVEIRMVGMCTDVLAGTKLPKLAKGVTIKPFEHGSTEKKYILASDNRHWIIAEELYEIVRLFNGKRTLSDIQAILFEEKNLEVTYDALELIQNSYLGEKGLLEGQEPFSEKTGKRKQSKYFWFQIPIISESLLKRMKGLALPFYKSAMVVICTLCIPALVYLLMAVSDPQFFTSLSALQGKEWFVLIGILILSGYLHELGHVGACIRYGMPPGHIGFAFYMTMPVLYADVSRVWGLNGKQRAIVDVGGMYFEIIFLSLTTVWSLMYGSSVVLLASAMRFIGLVYNFNPFLKMDGYWLFSDLTGITNLHDVTLEFIKTQLMGRKFKVASPVYEGLKPRVKRIFYLYVGASVLFFCFFLYLIGAAFSASIANMPVLSYDLGQYYNLIVSQSGWRVLLYAFGNLLKEHALLIITFILVLRILLKGSMSIISGLMEVCKNSPDVGVGTRTEAGFAPNENEQEGRS